ncbi:FAD-dependent oxidoreductase [Pseudaminobacter soli (ex Li et al. 2025)]|uniref:FAD/NAD(P)-binding oxidoreductase n=1 Tax=Pseudaminobacter soli (ex Li et al. 2025) TaxID=1295366 RepID=A0A2P7S0V5_9HYPH|nr:FAD-dependent oxidoreductase [Mesorhizobium soli]PSJ56072.1 FAD/NAD(P)-binding oxidoreductase [Mesorhizobium soli]
MSVRLINEAAQFAPKYDLVVVGAGPAGLSAAIEASASGASVLVVDENAAPGGQIYRAITRNAPERQPFLGVDYWKGREIAESFLQSPADYAPATTVWSLNPATTEDASAGPVLGVTLSGVARTVEARAVILATGAMERPMPVPGWTLPGVMSAGAAQIALKTVSAIPKGRIVLAGCGPLLYLLAAQLIEAGADIEALLDTADKGQRLAALRHLPDFLRSPYWLKGLALLLKVLFRTKVVTGVTALSIDGDRKAESVTFEAGHRRQKIPADCVLLHQGVIPGINLASAAGCVIEWNDRQRAFQPRTDPFGRTTAPGILVAGDGAEIAGAQHAAAAGRISAAATLEDIGILSNEAAASRLIAVVRARRNYLRGRAFLDTLYLPAQQFRAPTQPETIVCRCEEVRAGRLREAIALGALGPNQLKTFLRCGMGPCQGRMCASTVTEIMATEHGLSPAEIGTYRLRAPVKPLRLAELAALPQTQDAIFAVTGREATDYSPEEKGTTP